LNKCSFLQERALMQVEGVQVPMSDFVDNQWCLALLEEAGGIQATLDDVCKMPMADDLVFLDRLAFDKANKCKDMKGLEYLVIPKLRGTFVIKHYAASVAYSVEGFCERNKDILPASAVALIQSSTDAVLSMSFDLVAAEQGLDASGHNKKINKKSVSARFKSDLAALIDNINKSGAHFVRCINPNRHKAPARFDDQKVVEQLRCGGVIEAMRMARLSFPHRYTHAHFANSFVPFLCPDVSPSLSDAHKCLECFKALGGASSDYAVGKTLVLLKLGLLKAAESRRGAALFCKALTIQCALRRHAAGARHELKSKQRQQDLAEIEAARLAEIERARLAEAQRMEAQRLEAERCRCKLKA